jgi:hypothetical protein
VEPQHIFIKQFGTAHNFKVKMRIAEQALKFCYTCPQIRAPLSTREPAYPKSYPQFATICNFNSGLQPILHI